MTVRDGNHPIVKGLPPVWMHQRDELYSRMRGPGKNMTVLATAFPIRRTAAADAMSPC
jgi:uncharacterized protein